MRKVLWLFVPCFYDYQSFAELQKRAKLIASKELPHLSLRFVVIDDSGGQDVELEALTGSPDVEVVTAPYNLGHQGALVFGLRKMSLSIAEEDFVVTLDCDGEDRPEDIPSLLYPLLEHEHNLHSVCLAQRTKRNESLLFKTLYFFFKLFFSTLTGTVVRNGNFAAYRGWVVKNILFHPFFDYCYSSSLLALPINRYNIPLARGSRYHGTSKMTLVSLVSHGFRMLLPFSERIAIRSIILSFFLFAAVSCLAGIYTVLLVSGQNYPLLLVSTAVLVGLTALIAATSCIFFQIVNQTKALSLRELTSPIFVSNQAELRAERESSNAGTITKAVHRTHQPR